ncbi:hypothetical protein RHSP_24919 [Rhizobium freirei PRF 81]|uniref:Uncharacterized protein n=1 Tax=Rhizobium freirei PRF 81 TaxID=363754 RepID=N6U3N1_9HYPH|nr:hypothetical protein RHSP_24919 [Rhizobium freirei PRF 81]
MPGDALADVHPDLGLVVVPAPGRQQARLKLQVRSLADELVEDRAIDRLDRRIDRRWPCSRVERGQVDVEGDGQRAGFGCFHRRPACENPSNECCCAEAQGLAPSKRCHGHSVPLLSGRKA